MARAQKSGQVWVLTPANQIPEKGPKSRAFYDAMSGVLDSNHLVSSAVRVIAK
jgi:hypothetical protein